MRNTTVFSNRLDESSGIVENVLEMKAKKTPWHLRFAQKAKGLVSFLQNLLSPLTQKEGVRGGQLSAFFQSAAAVVVGIGLFASPFLVYADEEGSVDLPKVSMIRVGNHGSAGFEPLFSLSSSFAGQGLEARLYEWRDGPGLWGGDWWLADEHPFWDCGLCADPIDWYEIPNYDESSGSESFDFRITLFRGVEDPFSPTGYSPSYCGYIDVTLTVTTDEDGISPISITATATTYESNGFLAGFSEVDSYDITVYYSYGPSGPFNPLSE